MGAIRGEKSYVIPLLGIATFGTCTLVYLPALFRYDHKLSPFPAKTRLHESNNLSNHTTIAATESAIMSNTSNSDKTSVPTTLSMTVAFQSSAIAESSWGDVDFTTAAPAKYLLYPGGTPLALHWPRCAFVTGSGHLKGKKLGQEIDAYDCVIRPNDAPTAGYEKDVGSKTTLRTVSRRSLAMIKGRTSKGSNKFDKHFSDEILVVGSDFSAPSEARNLTDEFLKRWPTLIFYETTSEMLRALEELFEAKVARLGTEIWISNGFRSLILARDLCDEIHVYGIVDYEYCDRLKKRQRGVVPTQYYYYTRAGRECDIFNRHAMKKTWAHRFLREKKAFAQFAKEWGNLYFHEPEWPQLEGG